MEAPRKRSRRKDSGEKILERVERKFQVQSGAIVSRCSRYLAPFSSSRKSERHARLSVQLRGTNRIRGSMDFRRLPRIDRLCKIDTVELSSQSSIRVEIFFASATRPRRSLLAGDELPFSSRIFFPSANCMRRLLATVASLPFRCFRINGRIFPSPSKIQTMTNEQEKLANSRDYISLKSHLLSVFIISFT